MNSDNDNLDDQEYEYVDLGDYIKHKLDTPSEWLRGFAFPLICIGICIVCLILLKAGRQSAIIFMVIALVLLALFFAFALRAAWRDKKETAWKAQRAQQIYDFAQEKKTQENLEDSGDEHGSEDAASKNNE